MCGMAVPYPAASFPVPHAYTQVVVLPGNELRFRSLTLSRVRANTRQTLGVDLLAVPWTNTSAQPNPDNATSSALGGSDGAPPTGLMPIVVFHDCNLVMGELGAGSGGKQCGNTRDAHTPLGARADTNRPKAPSPATGILLMP